MALFERRRIKRRGDGTYAVTLPEHERQLLASLAGQLELLLTEAPDDPTAIRLFPNAYTDRPDLDDEFHRLMREDLIERHQWALETLADTAEAETLDEQQMSAWMGAINQVRLVLGTRLGVTDDEPDDGDGDSPEGQALAVYHYLSWLLEQVVSAMSEALPPPTPDLF